jgi:hypothetical protein
MHFFTRTGDPDAAGYQPLMTAGMDNNREKGIFSVHYSDLLQFTNRK